MIGEMTDRLAEVSGFGSGEMGIKASSTKAFLHFLPYLLAIAIFDDF